jgi:AhpD family alkylhydroperoxidase
MPFHKAWYLENSPSIGTAFAQFNQACNHEGVLDNKTRELLMTALACVFRCPHCTESHIVKALEAGATKQEVTEALLIASLEAAGTSWRGSGPSSRSALGPTPR